MQVFVSADAYLPVEQNVHRGDAAAGATLPSAARQSAQVKSPKPANFPIGHTSHLMPAASGTEPGSHAEQREAPAAESSPEGHEGHTETPPVEYEPASHEPQV